MKPTPTAFTGLGATSAALALGALILASQGLHGCSKKPADDASSTAGKGATATSGANASKPANGASPANGSNAGNASNAAKGSNSANGSAAAGPTDSGAPKFARSRRSEGTFEALYVGELTPEASLDLMTTVGGRLKEVLKKLGDTVEKGEVVAVMDDEEIRKQLHEGNVGIEAAKAGVARAEQEVARARTERLRASSEVRRIEVELGRAKRERNRNQPLFERGVINASAWDGVTTALEAAKAGIDSAKAAVESAKAAEGAAASAVTLAQVQVRQAQARVETGKVQLRNSRIKAPFGGTINQRYLDPGAFLVSMNPRAIVQIVVTSEVNARFKVPERDLRQLAVGKDVKVRVEAYPDEVFEGKVTRISAALETATRSAIVEASLPNKEGRLKPGMFARVGFPWTADTASVLVPQRAVVRDESRPGHSFVWTLEGGQARQTKVETIRDTGDDIEVRGLGAGIEVVVEGHARLKVGQAPTAPTSPAAPTAPRSSAAPAAAGAK